MNIILDVIFYTNYKMSITMLLAKKFAACVHQVAANEKGLALLGDFITSSWEQK
jgi:hypothetical protein